MPAVTDALLSTLESVLSDALTNALVDPPSNAEEVLTRIAHRLLAHGQTAQGPSLPSKVHLALRLADEERTDASDQEPKHTLPTWDAAEWLSSLGVAGMVSARLHAHTPTGAELPFVKALGAVADRESVLALLQAGPQPLLEELADCVLAGASRLAGGHASSGAELHDKFVQSGGAFTLSYGSLASFYSGLEGMIGPPSPYLLETMRKEHTESVDSRDEFAAGNYGTTTTSEIEWWFVVDPEHGLRRLGRAGWPDESKLRASHPERCRKPTPLVQLGFEMQRLNTALTEMEAEPLIEEELLATRLYTGPCFLKYNAVLRAQSEVPFLVEQYRTLCQGNKYVTTLTVINSCIVKCSKMTEASPVYRGISGALLPANFWEKDAYGVKGGVEYAFMSMTRDRAVALEYASSQGDGVGLVFEVEQGLIDRGADVSWLSQYPHEKEILFAPLTGLGVHGSRIDGNVLCLDLRLTVNLTALPIERVICKLQTSHDGLIKQMLDDLHFAGAPRAALLALHRARAEAAQHEPQYFNLAANYLAATREALQAQHDAFGAVSAAEAWEAEPGAAAAERMVAVAAICARAGQHGAAAALLRLAVARRPLDARHAAAVEAALAAAEGAGAAELGSHRWVLDCAAYALGELQLSEPFPATLTHLVGAAPPAVQRLLGVLYLALRHPAPGAGKLTREQSHGVAMLAERDAHALRPGQLVLRRNDERRCWDRGRIHAVLDGGAYEVKVGVRDFVKRIEPGEYLVPCSSGIGAVLLAAAAAGLPLVVGSLLAANVPATIYCDEHANTALHAAAARPGNAATVQMLLDAGAPRWGFNAVNRRPFFVAMVHHATDVRRVIKPSPSDLDFGPAPPSADTPVGAVAAAADAEAAAAALQLWRSAFGAAGGVDAAGDDGVTALMAAARFGRAEALQLLLDRGASTAARSRRGCTALSIAAEEGFAPLVRALLAASSAEVEAADECGLTPLHRAAQNGHSECAGLLLEGGAQIGAVSTIGAEVGSKLYESSVSSKGDEGSTSLHHAALNGHLETTRALLAARANVCAVKANGFTPLMGASYNGFGEVVAALLASGAAAALDVTDASGYTALIIASRAGDPAIVRQLLAAGANVHRKQEQKEGQTPLIAACGAGFESVARELLAGGARADDAKDNGFTALLSACYNRHTATARVLLQHGASPNLTDHLGFSAMHLSCRLGLVPLVQLLLRHGAKVNVCTREGETPLTLSAASPQDRTTIINLLLAAGADLEAAVPTTGWTALFYACKAGCSSVISTLLRAGARRDAKATDGSTPLDVCDATARAAIETVWEASC